ncbi:DJ-1/PfpI family protein [Sphingomonas sp. 2R-10]|uniref:DJ-1/PfpI family protein n=1 Tax=Sphingomonas sp. 2R-10 TaxID=3045148 RepID=UPI000F7A95EC|nr:DJ-1/PfpI family protein [Sphingomonas sp. 2R-10]MDJ0278547.1 DJ-1/PfpI family protein [Sphingomonas sp. 2R-10]
MTDQPFCIVFAIYPGMTQLDFTGPHQFLSRLPESEVVIASAAGGDVPSEGLTFAHTTRLADVDRCDLICLPGGVNATEVALDADFVGEVRRLGEDARYVTSVCTGSLILGAAGLLKGRRAACHWGWRHLLPLFGAIPDDARVVRDGPVITGGGVTAGIDFALTVLAEIAGPETAQTIQLGLEYAPEPPFDAGRPDTAPPAVLVACQARFGGMMARRKAEARKAAERLGLDQE